MCVDPTDESGQVGASGPLEGHAYSGPDTTSRDVQDKGQGLMARACTREATSPGPPNISSYHRRHKLVVKRRFPWTLQRISTAHFSKVCQRVVASTVHHVCPLLCDSFADVPFSLFPLMSTTSNKDV